MVQNHLVLLPGLDSTGALFDPFVNSPANRFTSTVVSQPFGQLLDYRYVIGRIRSAMPWDQDFTLVAESFAGPLALQFATAQRENINALVLSTAFASDPIPSLLRWTRCLLTDSCLQKKLPESLLKKLLLGEDCPAALAHAAIEPIRSGRQEGLARRILTALDTDARDWLYSWDKPILYLVGTKDKILGRRGLEAIRAVRPDVPSVEIDGPHLLLQSRPEAALQAIEKFLQEKGLLKPKPPEGQFDLEAPVETFCKPNAYT